MMQNIIMILYLNCESCYIVGGQEYLHFGGNDFNEILIIFDDGTEILACDEKNIKRIWGMGR